MIELSIPPPLLKFSNGESKLSLEGASLANVQSNLKDFYPQLYAVLFGDSGNPQPYVNFFVDSCIVDREADWSSMHLKPDSRIEILIAVAGG
jgi:hypothetical protein